MLLLDSRSNLREIAIAQVTETRQDDECNSLLSPTTVPKCFSEKARMTLEEFDQTFPNGFSDAKVRGISIDYTQRTATLQLDLRANPPDSPDHDVYSAVVLTLSGLCYLSIDPPDTGRVLRLDNEPLTVDGDCEDPQKFLQFQHAHTMLGDKGFYCRFFVHDWNSFIHVAAAECNLLSLSQAAS